MLKVPEGAGHPKRVLTFVLCFALAISGASPRIVGPLITSISRDFNITIEAAGNLVSIQQFGYLSAVLASGYLGDRLGKRTVLGAGHAILICALTAFALVKWWPALMLAQLLVGLGQSAVLVSSIALVSELHEEERTSAVGLTMTAVGVGSVGAMWLAGLFLDAQFPWPTIVYLLIVLTCTSYLLLLPFSHEMAAVDAKKGHTIHTSASLLGSPVMRFLIAISMTINGAQALLSVFTAPYVELVLGASVGVAALAPSAVWLGITLGRIAYSMVIERLDKNRVWISSVAVSALLVSVLPFISGVTAMIGVLGICGTFIGMVAPPAFSRSTTTYPGRAGTATGVVAMSAGIGAVVAIVIGGGVSQFTSLASIFWLTSLGLVICLAAVCMLCRCHAQSGRTTQTPR